MNCRVFYVSQTGNTEKVAEAMARALGCEAEVMAGDGAKVVADTVFLGAAVYATFDHGVKPEVKAFLEGLDPAKVGKVALFCTGFSTAAVDSMRAALERRRIKLHPESFYCKGKLFVLFNAGHPDRADLAAAAEFALRAAK
jgi:flavodoxin